MDERDIRKIVQEEIDKNYRSGSPKVPRHRHDGNDNLKIDHNDLILGNKNVANLSISDGNFVLNLMSNPSSLIFCGIAGDGVNKRAIVNGRIELGDCLSITSIDSFGNFTGTKSNFIQMSNSFYENDTGPVMKVGSSTTSFAYVTDGSSIFVKVYVTSWIGNTIKGTATISAGWQLTGSFLMK